MDIPWQQNPSAFYSKIPLQTSSVNSHPLQTKNDLMKTRFIKPLRYYWCVSLILAGSILQSSSYNALKHQTTSITSLRSFLQITTEMRNTRTFRDVNDVRPSAYRKNMAGLAKFCKPATTRTANSKCMQSLAQQQWCEVTGIDTRTLPQTITLLHPRSWRQWPVTADQCKNQEFPMRN